VHNLIEESGWLGDFFLWFVFIENRKNDRKNEVSELIVLGFRDGVSYGQARRA
jgi:hypothetical protein